MVGSRHLFGTVLTRVRNLLQSGALTKKLVWLDVVEAFPPLVETKINRRAEPGRAPKIAYPEDEFRNKFYKTFKMKEPLSLFEGIENKPNSPDRFVEKCQSLMAGGRDSETAFNDAAKLFKQGKLAQEKSTGEQNNDESNTKPITNILDLFTDHGKSGSKDAHTANKLNKGELEDKPI